MKYIILILFSFFLLSCIKNSHTYTPEQYNNNIALVKINGVNVKKKQSILGHIIQASSMLVGGYAGYKVSPLITNYKTDGIANKSTIGGAGIGAFIGFGINNSINQLMGRGKVYDLNTNSKEFNIWEGQFNKKSNYAFIGNGDNWLYLDKTKESTFRISNLEDLKIFQTAFPQSIYMSDKVNQAINNFARSSIESAIDLYKNTTFKDKLQDAFLAKSIATFEIFDVINKYPSLKLKAEDKLFGTLNDKDDILSFIKLYPETKYKADLFKQITNNNNLFNSCSKSELQNLLAYFKIDDLKAKDNYISAIIEKTTSFSDISSDLLRYPSHSAQIESKAVDLINDLSTHYQFITKFPNSTYIHTYEDGWLEPAVGKIITKKWDETSQKPSNFIKVVFKSPKETYLGEYYNGKKYGKGILDTTPEDSKTKVHYEGSFSNGEFNGEGNYTFGDGTYTGSSHVCNVTYSGSFKNSLFEGQGTASGILGDCYSWFADNYATYTGGWKEGKFHGNGRYTFGELWYEGGFQKGAMSGQGMLRFPNGIRVEGPWKDHNPNGRMHLFKFTLGGLIREDDYINAYNIKDLSAGESNLIDKWESSRRKSNDDAEERRKKEEEEDERQEAIEAYKENEEYIKDCSLDINKSLKKATYKEEGIFNDCPCIFYEDPSFLGYRLILKENKDNEWYFKVTALLNFEGWQGPYVSKSEMLRVICEKIK
jgi:hypothetical protein